MGEALRVDELWDTVHPGVNVAQHLETNQWLMPFSTTTGGLPKRRPEPRSIEFMGQTILWTVDGDRPFPKWVANALAQLLVFSELSVGWNSYGGRPLQVSAVRPTLQLLVAVHIAGKQARLVPLPSGGVGLRLENEGRVLDFDVHGSGTIEGFLEIAGSDDFEIGPQATLAEAEKLLSQFLA